MTHNVYNFGAGPAMLPDEVVEATALRHGAGVEQNTHTMLHFKTAKSAIK